MSIRFTDINIEKLLDEAIGNNRIIAYYQPKYDVITGKIIGAEALARWLDDDGNIIPPGTFIPVLERSSLITKLDWYMLNIVCNFLKEQIDSGAEPTKISVNFSRAHTYEPRFIQKLCSFVDSFNIPHNLIEVEVTESLLSQGKPYITEFISSIRKSGFDVAIDDFNIVLSSLNYLEDLPASVLKINSAMIAGNLDDEKKQVIIESIFNFAQNLRMTTVAEGIEDKKQLEFIRSCGCEQIQGYYFSKPVSQEEYSDLCRASDTGNVSEDILVTQPFSSTVRILLDTLFRYCSDITVCNLSRKTCCPMTDREHAANSTQNTEDMIMIVNKKADEMDGEIAEKFRSTFDPDAVRKALEEGKDRIVLTGKNKEGHTVETEIFRTENILSDDILGVMITREISE